MDEMDEQQCITRLSVIRTAGVHTEQHDSKDSKGGDVLNALLPERQVEIELKLNFNEQG